MSKEKRNLMLAGGCIALFAVAYLLFAYPLITTVASVLPTGDSGLMSAVMADYMSNRVLTGFRTVTYLTPYGMPAYLLLAVILGIWVRALVSKEPPANPELDSMPARADSNECGHDKLLRTARDLKGHPCIDLVPRDALSRGGAGFYLGECEGKIALMRGDNHLCVTAPTNSGKSRRFVLQNIYTITQGGDNFFVTDQKGEIYCHTRNYLTEGGNFSDKVPYEINVINLSAAESTNTNLWNPMYRAIDAYRQLRKPGGEKGREPSLFSQVNEMYGNFKRLKAERQGYKPSRAELERLQGLKDRRDALIQKAEHEIEILYDSIHSLKDSGGKENKFYVNGSRDVIMMVLHYLASSAACPDSEKTFKTASDIMSEFLAEQPVNPADKRDERVFIPLFEEISRLDSSHPAYKHMRTLCGNNKYLGDFVNDAKGQLSEFSTIACQRMMSGTDFPISELANPNRKVATFVIIPPHATAAQKRLATIYIEQALTVLMETAERHGGRLPRRMNMVMEELGQLEAIPHLEQRLAFTRGAGIRWMLVLQSLNQLSLLYGRDALPVILDNCKVHIVMGSNDPETKKRYSSASGKYTKVAESTSSSKATLGLFSDRSTDSARYAEQACITEETISNWNTDTMGAMVFCTGAMTAVLSTPDISDQEFNDILGLGDEEFNRALCSKVMAIPLSKPVPTIPWSPELNNATLVNAFLTDDDRKRIRGEYIAKLARGVYNKAKSKGAALSVVEAGNAGGGDKSRLDGNGQSR